jgi:RsiW-degrading membrane proteinase PrsW (M82 family)
MVLLFGLSVGWGVWVSVADVFPAVTLPLAHVATMALPSLIILGLVGRALKGAGGSWREVVLNVAGGGLVGTSVALVAEAVVVFLLAAGVAAVLMMTPEGAAQLTHLLDEMQDPTWLMETENLFDLLLSPVVAVSVLSVVTIPVPLIEETVKTLLGGAWSGWRRPRPARAFLWGVAAGAGFALFESLFNGSLGGAEAWGASAVARIGAAVMHCFTGGLMGWGWGQAWSARRPLRLFASYAAAVLLHGLWNGIAVGTAFLGALTLAYESQAALQGWISAGAVVLTGLLGALTVAGFVALLWIARRLAPVEADLEGDRAEDEASIP